MENGKIVLGALAGIAIGAAVGILLAPDKGSETRKKISKKRGELAHGLKEKYDHLRGKYNSAIDNATSKLESFAQKGEDLAQAGKNALSDVKTATR
jgi:gas vesicle protein